MLTGLFATVVVAWLVVVTGVVVWLVVVVWVVDVVVLDFFGADAVVVVCAVAMDAVWVATVWVLAVLWVLDDVLAARALRGFVLLAVVVDVVEAVDVVVRVDPLSCVVEVVLEPLAPHPARLSMSTTTLRAAIKPRTLTGEE